MIAEQTLEIYQQSTARKAFAKASTISLLLADLHGLVNAERVRHAGVRTGIGSHNTEGAVADFRGIVVWPAIIARHGEVALRSQRFNRDITPLRCLVAAFRLGNRQQVIFHAD